MRTARARSSAAHLFTILFRPEGPGPTLETADMLVHPEVLAAPGTEAKIGRVHDFWAMVIDQDIRAVEGVEQRIQARAYPGGRMCFRFEEPLHRFQNMVIDLMTGRLRIPPGDPDDPSPVSAAARRGQG